VAAGKADAPGRAIAGSGRRLRWQWRVGCHLPRSFARLFFHDFLIVVFTHGNSLIFASHQREI
jgi:hypothetical protein